MFSTAYTVSSTEFITYLIAHLYTAMAIIIVVMFLLGASPEAYNLSHVANTQLASIIIFQNKVFLLFHIKHTYTV